MTDFPFSQPAAPTAQVSAAPATVINVLLSSWALTAEAVEGVAAEEWIAQTAAQLTPAQRSFNRLLFAAFGAALLPPDPPADFPAYLDWLAAPPTAHFHAQSAESAPRIAPLPLPSEAALLADPPALQGQIVAHLRMLWESWLAAEWQRPHARLLSRMTQSINELIFSQPQWQSADPVDALRYLLQTEPDARQLAQVSGVQRIVLVFSPHLRAHCTRLGSSDTLWVVRTFDPQLMRREPLRRAEVLGPLGALADETRLRILELLVEHGEQRAQEIIAHLAGSQGNVSRHLKQLAGAGFVRERRAGDANKLYTYDPAGLKRLQFVMRNLLSSHNAQAAGSEAADVAQLSQVRADAPPELRGLLDKQGRITRWASKLKEQAVMLEYLIAKFEPERGYTEAQVNELLQRWYLDADFVLVRRSMIDAGLLHRTKDGARYWRAS